MNAQGSSTVSKSATAHAQPPLAASRLIAEDPLLLPSLISSRICHDLISPVNALSNGVEFMTGPGGGDDGRAQALKIIGDSVSLATARLQYFRACFGAGGALGDHAQLSALRELTEGYLQGSRVSLDWEDSPETLDRDATRLMLTLVLLGIEALPRGGVLRVGVVRKEALILVVLADGPMIRVSDDRAALCLSGQLADPAETRVEPKDAPALLAHELAVVLGADLRVVVEEGRATFAATVSG